jgi:hypothetical protein
MSTAPSIEKEERAKRFFPALKVVAGCGVDVESSMIRKRKIGKSEPEGLGLRR